MAVTSAINNIVNVKEKGHFLHENARIKHENERINKYTLADDLPAQLSELGLRPRTMSKPAFVVRKVTVDEKEQVVKFLEKFFFRDEPMNLAVKLLETPGSRCIELEQYATSSLDDEMSVAAVDENGEFVGIVINGLSRREDAGNSSEKTEECANPKFSRILQVLCHLDREARIWEKVPPSCNTIMEIKIASTHTAWRGQGLMRILCEESERIAKEVGASVMRMDTTSAFSAAAAERLNYKQVYAVRYSELPYAPQPDPPHLDAKVYIKQL